MTHKVNTPHKSGSGRFIFAKINESIPLGPRPPRPPSLANGSIGSLGAHSPTSIPDVHKIGHYPPVASTPLMTMS